MYIVPIFIVGLNSESDFLFFCHFILKIFSLQKEGMNKISATCLFLKKKILKIQKIVYQISSNNIKRKYRMILSEIIYFEKYT